MVVGLRFSPILIYSFRWFLWLSLCWLGLTRRVWLSSERLKTVGALDLLAPPLKRVGKCSLWADWMLSRRWQKQVLYCFRLFQYFSHACSKPIRKSLIPCAIKRPLWVARNAFQPAANASCISAWMESPRPRIAFWWVSSLPKGLECLLGFRARGLMLRVVSVPM